MGAGVGGAVGAGVGGAVGAGVGDDVGFLCFFKSSTSAKSVGLGLFVGCGMREQNDANLVWYV